jgi:hypothetical protein
MPASQVFLAIKKDLAVLVLIGFLFAMDLLKITDPELKYTLMGLVTLVTGYGGVIGAKQALGGGASSPQ